MPRAKRAAIAFGIGLAAAGAVHAPTRASALNPRIATAQRQVNSSRIAIEQMGDDRFLSKEQRNNRDRRIAEFRAGRRQLQDLKFIQKWKVPAALGSFVLGAGGTALLLTRRGKNKLLQKALAEGVLFDHRYPNQSLGTQPDILLVPLAHQSSRILGLTERIWKANNAKKQRAAIQALENELAAPNSALRAILEQYPGRFIEWPLNVPVTGKNQEKYKDWPKGPYLILLKETVPI